MQRIKEKVYMWLAWRIPKTLAYWVFVRVFSNATTGAWSNEEVPGVTCEQAMRRWKY